MKTRAVSNGAVAKPGLALCRFRKVRTKSEAPTSKISATATSMMTSALRNRAPRLLCPDPRAPSRSISCRLRRPACSAGAKPKIRPVSADTTMV